MTATEDIDTRTRTLRDKVNSADWFFSSSKQVSGLSSPLQPSPRPVAPSPARKKAKSNNGENRGIARALFQPPGTTCRTTPSRLIRRAIATYVICSASCSSHFSISTAPLRIPRPDPSTSTNVAARLLGNPRPEPGALSNSWKSSSTCVICSASCSSHFFISTAPLRIPRPDPSTSTNVAARLLGIPRHEPGALSNSWKSSSTCIICSASFSSHFSISTAPLRPKPGALTNVTGSQSSILRRSATRTTLQNLKPKIDMWDLQYVIDEECSKLCSKNRTVFRTVSTTEFARFTFDVYERELKEIAPTLLTVLKAAAMSLNTDYKRTSAPTSSSSTCVVTEAVLLKERNLHMTAIQHHLSLLLWHGNSSTMVAIIRIFKNL